MESGGFLANSILFSLIIGFLLLGSNSAWAQGSWITIGSVSKLNASASKADAEFVNHQTTLNQERKERRLDELWKAQKEKFKVEFSKPYVSNMKIYNAQKDLSTFLQHAIQLKRTDRIRDVAELYLILLKDLRESPLIEIIVKNPVLDPAQQCTSCSSGFCRCRIATQSGTLKYWPSDLKEGKFRENIISSSQMLYPISVILHHSASENLEMDSAHGPFFKDFRHQFFPLLYQHHFLRWILGRNMKSGTFARVDSKGVTRLGDHSRYLQGLIQKEYTFNSYDNMMQDRDGWIALGMGHLLAAHDLKPDWFQMVDSDFRQLRVYFESFMTLFHSRMEFELFTVPNSKPAKTVELMTIDKGGMLGWKHLNYSGYSGKEFPGQKWNCKTKKDCDELAEQKGEIVKVGTPLPIANVPVSWDLSHSRRFVNFFWSMHKLESFRIKGLDSSQKESIRNSLTRAAQAYANNLLYRVTIRKDYTDSDFLPSTIHFTNFLCGANGWYRVDYLDQKYFGYAPSSIDLEHSLLSGGQVYFAQFNPDLEKPFQSLYLRTMTSKSSFGQTAELQILPLLPNSFLNSNAQTH